MKKNSPPSFHFQRIHQASSSLLERLKAALASSKQEQVRRLGADLDEISRAKYGDGPVTLSFVGQYNAGKSTLVRGLTQNADITIDADVCTNVVTAFDWGGLRVIDTPGIHAGFPSHDDLTEEQVSRSHLLVFVITGELFGDDMAKYFRDLAFEKNYAPKLMLVVNKMDGGQGSAETKRADIERITNPLKMEEFRTVFVSGEVYLDALKETDPETKAALIEESGMPGLMAGLDAFAKDCGLVGALTAPLFGARSIATQAAGTSSADRPEERAAIELLGRRGRVLRESRHRLSSTVERLLNDALADLAQYGDSAAGEITPSKKKEEIDAAMKKAERAARDRVEELKTHVTAAISTEQATLEEELRRLAAGDLAAMLRREAEVSAGFKPEAGQFGGQAPEGSDPSAAARIKKAGAVANDVGAWLVRFSQGTKGISGWGKAAAAGSQAHKMVYDIGKLFGHSFKPWEAAGYAAKLGNIGRVLGPVAAILQVVGQVLEEKLEDEEQAEFQTARTNTRAIFRDGATAVRHQFLVQFEAFLNDFYGSMQAETDRMSDEMAGARSGRNAEASAFGKIADEAAALVGEIEEAVQV
jgi:hypothetical protein